ncbi:oligosaccharyl transferase, archaeosortase A system-associated [Salinirubellus salinus]|uniref:dolichyl-phosphooligosaccharide-protein glycotransferase n=1 Tax=Salinirubellus salinus TaxID=1364945 RepID=A0A9E7R815_9EURY|nr:oligosaccharyl transferase, archaeosortase A system-associated [Salinirubellus salinus]UWM56365.1 oligosaccharyl transferase, archaeosortase A system-associated [Salinirubellus salinus]
MSQPSESESLSERIEGLDGALDSLREVYHVPLLGAMFAFMLWVRARHWERFQVDGQVLFSGNDAWYHYRMVEYTVRNFPATMPFDPWTRFPEGTSVGQFGTLFDQLMALAALIVGLGSPTTEQIRMVVLFTPAVMGALVIVPVYLIGARLSNRVGGLVAALVVALTPGQFLTRSLVGFADHHVAETMFMALAALALLVAIDVAMRDKPAWELLRAGEFDALRPTLLWSGLAGVAAALYIWVWPPGVFFVGILGVFFGVAMLLQYVSGVSPDHLGIVGVTVGLVAAVLALVPISEFGLSATNFSLAQPLLALGLAAGAAVVAGGARVWDARDLDKRGFPLALLTLAFGSAFVVALVLPDVFGFFSTQVTRVVGLSSTATALTVGEAQPPSNPSQFIYDSYGLAFFTAVAGLVLALYRSATDRELAPKFLFLAVWGVFLFLATMTQQRFDYYLVLAVASANAVFFSWVFDLVDLGSLARDVSNLSAYQVLTILAVVMVLTVPMTYRPGGTYANAMQSADQQAGPGLVQNWDESLAWMSTETPEVGAYGTGDEGELLEYYGTYPRQDDFAYSEGSYGVISWWDYGHWITTLGERPAFANPFQQNAEQAANFLLATNETEASGVLVSESGEQTRYVMLDYQLGLAGTRKYSAPAAWESAHDVTGGELSQPVLVQSQGSLQLGFSAKTERGMRSMRTRLYEHHGSAVGPESANSALGSTVVVVDWETTSIQGQQYPVLPSNNQPLRAFGNLSEAEEFVRQDGTAQVGGVLGEPPTDLPALQHYRLVDTSPQNTASETPASRIFRFTEAARTQQNPNALQPINVQPWVKTFERVEGATVEGEGPADTTVTARVRMQVPGGAGNFTYVQHAETDADGQFEMVLPYSTTGYDEYGPENGYTNVSVRATGPYQFSTQPTANESAYITRSFASVDVSEGQVVGAEDGPVQVTMEEQVLSQPEGANTNGTDSTNTSDSTTDTSTNSSDSTSTDGTNSTSTNTTSTNDTASLVRPPVVAPTRG